ncbi:MAG: hypothetical protein SGJ19_20350 [Planctomycetia bacterium]|nr:hypothetical protein [Planctomycetia bacterium]
MNATHSVRFTLLAACCVGLSACASPFEIDSNPLRTASAKRTYSAPRKGTVSSTAQVNDENVKPETTKALPIKPAQCVDRSPALPYSTCSVCQRGPAGACYHDEYLCDGGDEMPDVQVAANWEVLGLGIEDTVAHYDTVPGRTCVVPSNKVCIYAPRFRSVRHITRLALDEEYVRPTGYHAPAPPVLVEGRNMPTTTLEQDRVRLNVQDKLALAYENRLQDGAVSMALKPEEFLDAMLPYEDLQIVKIGVFDERQRALLIEGSNAAITWTHDKAVQILIEGKAALTATEIDGPEIVYQTHEPCPGKLRVIKVASTQFAEPGDLVDFTLRYDNIGGQAIGNVTLVDNLTTRLEYLADSAKSSRRAEFYSERNEAESLVLRWEITDPVEPGQGGVVRFKCRVR